MPDSLFSPDPEPDADPFSQHAKASSVPHTAPRMTTEERKAQARANIERPKETKPYKCRGRRAINTTKLMIAYVKAEGHEILATEESQAYKKDGEWRRRSSDRRMKMDVMSRAPDKSIWGWQGAGVGERKSHFEGFLGQGGESEAKRWYDHCVYVEFRHDESVAKYEVWL